MLLFNRKYATVAIVLFVIEVAIALFVKDRFVRPYGGDVLVVMLIYATVKAFLTIETVTLAFAVLLFAFGIEFLQYLNVVERFGLTDSPVISTVLGTSFAWMDLVAYLAGTIILLLIEKLRGEK